MLMRFFKTSPHKCSYIEGESAETVFLDPDVQVSPELYERLNDVGFRRSGPHFYRPDCAACNRCQPVRVRVREFAPRRRHRRIRKRNQDIRWRIAPIRETHEHWPLYEAYIAARHAAGDMYPPDPEEFRRFLLTQTQFGFLLEGHLDGQLVVVSVVDRLQSGLSAIYTFFDPACSDRSLGTAAILRQIELADELEMPFLYLGYWIRELPAMSYKSDFAPLDVYRNEQWQPMNFALSE